MSAPAERKQSIVKHLVSTIKSILGLKGVSVTETTDAKTNSYHMSEIEKKVNIAKRTYSEMDSRLKNIASGNSTSIDINIDAPLLEGYKVVFKNAASVGMSYHDIIHKYVNDLIAWPPIDYSYIYNILKRNADSYRDTILVKAMNKAIITDELLMKICKDEWDELAKDAKFADDFRKFKDTYKGKDKESITTDDAWRVKFFKYKFNLKYQFKHVKPVIRDILFRIKDKKDLHNGIEDKLLKQVMDMDDKALADILKVDKDGKPKKVVDEKLREAAIFWNDNGSTIKLLEIIMKYIQPAKIVEIMAGVKKSLDEWDAFNSNVFKNVNDDLSMIKALMSIIKFINKDSMIEGKKIAEKDADEKTKKDEFGKLTFTISSPLFDDMQFPIAMKNMLVKSILRSEFKVGDVITDDALVAAIAPHWSEFIVPKKYDIRSTEYYNNLASMLVADAGLNESFFNYAEYLKYAVVLYVVFETLTDAIRHSTSKSLIITA